MTLQVSITQAATYDLFAITEYYQEKVSDTFAEDMLNRLRSAAYSLSEQPERGAVPEELRSLTIQRYRSLLVPPFRIIYRVDGSTVHIVMFIDDRRDLSAAILRRNLFS